VPLLIEQRLFRSPERHFPEHQDNVALNCSSPSLALSSYGNKLTREKLARLVTPAATATQKLIPHIAVVEKLIEALSFRQIGFVLEEYAVSADGRRVSG